MTEVPTMPHAEPVPTPRTLADTQYVKLQHDARNAATQAADADPSDPFIYARTYTHFMLNIGVDRGNRS